MHLSQGTNIQVSMETLLYVFPSFSTKENLFLDFFHIHGCNHESGEWVIQRRPLSPPVTYMQTVNFKGKSTWVANVHYSMKSVQIKNLY